MSKSELASSRESDWFDWHCERLSFLSALFTLPPVLLFWTGDEDGMIPHFSRSFHAVLTTHDQASGVLGFLRLL